jgi:iron complex outermembrane receptor protein
VGLNLNGVPTDAQDRPVLSAATVKPEDVRHIEVGVKSTPFTNVTANVSVYDTEVDDFQAQVVNAGVGVLRGYLANAERVRVRGLEFDGGLALSRALSFYLSAAFTDGKYVSFPDAPPPLEDTGGPQVKDVSDTQLPGISKSAISFGGEYSRDATAFGRPGQVFGAFDASYRSSFSSSASASSYLVVEGYSLVNARVGFRAPNGWTLSLWARNLLDKDYFDLLSPAPGNSGLFVGQPGDPRTFGITLRVTVR